MQIIRGTTVFELDGRYAVAIGKFDGIHRGHRRLIDDIIDRKDKGLKSAVFTFDPSPAMFFGDGSYKGLTTVIEKRRILEKLGVDVLVEYPLNRESAATAPEEFVQEILLKQMHTSVLVCGPDLTFGGKGLGNVDLLRKLSVQQGFELRVHEKVRLDGQEISSSYVRQELSEGHMENVAELIGAPYSVTGTVMQGRRIGRTIGRPTVNIIPEEDKMLPPFGVYSAEISYKGEHYRGITNIGVKPTVTDENKITVETFILDFDRDIYGEEIIVNLMHFIRPERRFDSVEKLKEQIAKDMKCI
ncbi:MAG: bifunctional riboflavin kinase/FAD synthetase [Lachnospiraceae bacterium]|nr:bifunctional riboflavin kinase/FAD synthetase [Lachnospiraceae bacterium]